MPIYSLSQIKPMAQTVLRSLCAQKKNIIALSGGLGAGKTTFAQAIGKILQIKETINSPTFNLLKTYPVSHRRFSLLCHIDAYRLSSEEELTVLGALDYFQDPKTITIIEWPEHVLKIIPPSQSIFLKIAFTKKGNYRKITL